MLHLASGKLAVLNISFLVSDDDLTTSGILIGRPILQHLRVDTKTLLESNRTTLDGTDCASVGNPTVPGKAGSVSTIMTSRANDVEDHIKPQDPGRPRVNYFTSRKEVDPFPDSSLLDPVKREQGPDIDAAIAEQLDIASKNGLTGNHLTRLRDIVHSNTNIFRVGLSSGEAANIPPLRISLTPDARPTRVKLRNYS